MKHTTDKWFSNKKLYEYFNTDFKRNKVGNLAFPRSIIKSFTRNNAQIDQATINKITDSLGQSVIDAIVKKHFNLTAFDFEYLLPEHQEYLKEAVCYEIQEVIYNKKTMERTGGASISTPSFTIGVDSTNWLFTYDEISVRGKELIALADLPNYKIVGDNFVGQIAYQKAKGELVLHQWNNIELGKEIAEAGFEGKAYTDFIKAVAEMTRLTAAGMKIDKYDYIFLNIKDERALMRFEGGDWTKYDNWDRKDTKHIDGNRYLVYKNYMLAGSAGTDGVNGQSFKAKGIKNTLADIQAIVRPDVDDAWVAKDSGHIYVFNGDSWIDMGKFNGKDGEGIHWLTDNYADLTEFGNTAKDFEVVKYNLNPDGTNNNEGFVFIIKTTGGLKQFRTWEEILTYIQANDWESAKKIGDFTFGGTSAGGAISYSEHFGDLDDQAQRTNFMNNVQIGKWYTFNINGVPYEAAIISGDKTTNFIWSGQRVIQGATGNTNEFVNGSTSTTGHAETAGSFTGDAFSPSIALPDAYAPTQYIPNDAIRQMIDNKIALVSNEQDRSWLTPDGTQSTTFTSSKITVTWQNSGLVVDNDIQLLLGSTGGNLVLDASINVYADEATAKKNANTSGTYSWYMFQTGATTTFVMEDSAGGLTDTGQNIAKYRYATPTVKAFDAHYTSQADVLKATLDIKAITKGTSQTVTIPGGLTTDTLTQLGLSVSGTTDWFNVEGWNKSEPMYINVTTEDAGNFWWIEYKVEAVSGDKTKLKLTNMMSGNNGTDNASYVAHWLQAKGGR